MALTTKCKDCTYYKRIDETQGHCRRYPPINKNDGREEHVKTPKDDTCGEFVQET